MCAVRNPFDRAVSQIRWKLRNHPERESKYCTSEAVNTALREELNTIRESLAAVEAGFPNLGKEDILLPGRDPTMTTTKLIPGGVQGGDKPKDLQNQFVQPAFRDDCHWLPQWMYIEDECQHRMHTESLNDDFARLMGLRQMHEGTKHINVVDKNNCPFTLDEQSKGLISEMYAKDILLYGYKTDGNIDATLSAV